MHKRSIINLNSEYKFENSTAKTEDNEFKTVSKVLEEKDQDKKPVLTEKENKLELGVQQILDAVDSLKIHGSKYTTELDLATKQKFDQFRKIVSVIRDSDIYEKLYNIILSRFVENVEEMPYYSPGTIGAYITGCNHDAESLPFSINCAATCAGSIENPEGHDACTTSVVLWKKVNEFQVLLDKTRSSNNAILYVPFLTEPEWPGLSKKDKAALRAFGINCMKVIGNVDLKMAEFTSVCVPIDQIKGMKEQTETQGDNNSRIILVVVIIAILIVGGYIFYKNRKNKH